MRPVREVIEENGAVFGAWSVLPSPFATEVLARSGYDWMCVDCQHGMIGSVESLMPLLQVINRHDVPAFVRIPWKSNLNFAMYALDYGAQGLIVPMIDTPEEAEVIARAMRYPPDGERSWAPMRASLEIEGYTTTMANELVCCLPMIETTAGLANLEEILAVPGVDGAYIGPSDLLISQGATAPAPSRENAQLVELGDRILEACRAAGKIAGIQTNGPDEAVWWADRGFQMVNVSSDAGTIMAGSRAHLTRLAELRPKWSRHA